MSAAVLCIGTEITRGEIVNTNATWLCNELTALGYEVTEVVSVDDDRGRIVEALRRLGQVHELIACTGGLGPTTDDVTTESAALAAGDALVRDVASIEHIRTLFQRLGRTMGPSNTKQADFPSRATVIANPVGTAPGFYMRMGKALAVFMPGVPRETHPMWRDHVAPMIEALAPATTFQSRLRTFGKPESTVGELLRGVEELYPGLIIGYRASFPEIEVKLLARAGSRHAAERIVQEAEVEVRRRLGDIIFGEEDDSFVSAVATAVRKRGWHLALAESCTGGLVAQMLTSEPASDYLLLGVVTYANEMKTSMLGVPAEMLAEHGAVSEQVAVAMAKGACQVSGAEVGVGITGIAGPTGGSEQKPVGLVHWAVAHPGGVSARHRVFAGDRYRIQKMAAYAALALVRETAG